MSPTLYTARNNGKENNGGNNGDKYNNDKQWNKVQRSLECVSKFSVNKLVGQRYGRSWI